MRTLVKRAIVPARGVAPFNGNKSDSHVPMLDGVRGLAIIAVMIYHFSHLQRVSSAPVDEIYYSLVMTGWMGVDLFFVLSGYLITGILLSTRDAVQNYFSVFYIRRALRIFPLYYAYIAAFLLLLPIADAKFGAAPDAKIAQMQDDSFWLWFYLSNLRQLVTGTGNSLATGHFWSLAVEEQFYLIWPVLVFNCRRRTLGWMIALLIVVAPLVRFTMWVNGVEALAIYSFTFARMDALLWGAAVALSLEARTKESYIRSFAGPAALSSGILSLIVLFAFGPAATTEPGMYVLGLSIPPIFFATMLVVILHSSRSILVRCIESPILRFFGRYSYGLYIFHVPIRAAAIAALPAPILLFDSQLPWQLAVILICGLVSILVALLSWHLYEKHFLRLKKHFPYNRALTPYQQLLAGSHNTAFRGE